jgi:hypothetical protein
MPLVASVPLAAAEFPFTGYIASERAEVTSGAGRRFYVTDHLERGTPVEVYREDDAGWLAIRPPEGSFSWIPAEQVEFIDDGVGKVRVEAQSWIGTRIEHVEEHKQQITLKAGELVEIIGEKAIAGDDGKTVKWLRIAPPAGEFRYVHSRDVSREKIEPEPEPTAVEADELTPAMEELAADEVMEPAVATEEPRKFRASADAIALRDIDEVQSKLARVRQDLEGLASSGRNQSGRNQSGRNQSGGKYGVEPAQFKSSADGPSNRSLSPDGFVPRKRRGSEPLQTVPVPNNQFTGTSTRPSSRSTAVAPRLDAMPRIADARAGEAASHALANTPRSSQQSGSAANQLDAWELELSLMLSQDRSTWNLAGLRQQVEAAVESGSDPVERGRARLLLDKIRQFETTFDAADIGPIGTTVGSTRDPAAGSLADPRCDARGWLKPVISKSKPTAPYAIVDAEGKPLCFVSPSPGMNLGRYVNKLVGLYGRRGYIETLKTPHVTAERVIDLERVVR